MIVMARAYKSAVERTRTLVSFCESLTLCYKPRTNIEVVGTEACFCLPGGHTHVSTVRISGQIKQLNKDLCKNALGSADEVFAQHA